MARKAVTEAVDARLAAEWTHTAIVPFAATYEPPEALDEDGNPVPWLTVQYAVSETASLVLDDDEGPFKERGIIFLILHVSRVADFGEVQNWLDELFDLFNRKRFDGVHCLDATSSRMDNDADLGNYLQFTVSVPYEFQFDYEEV